MIKRYKIQKYYNFDGLDFYAEYEVLVENQETGEWDTVDYADTHEEAVELIKTEIENLK